MRCGACSMQGRNKKCIQNFDHKTEGKRSLGRSRNKWEDNMKTVLNQWWIAFWAKRPNQEKTCWQATLKVLHIYFFYVSVIYDNTGLFKMIVRVLTTCHTQYTWDRTICIFLFNRTTLQVFVTYLTGALYVHPLWFYKHQHNNRVRSTQNAFSLPFEAILVNCAPSGEMHIYCTPHIIKENCENFLIHRCNYILLSQVYCVWQVVKTPTVILNNPVHCHQ